jgi:HPr kinase/phosphorylase
MLSTVGRLLEQLNPFCWMQKIEKEKVDLSRGVDSIEPVYVTRYLWNEEKVQEGSLMLFDDVSFSLLEKMVPSSKKSFLNRVINASTSLVIFSCPKDQEQLLLLEIEKHCLQHQVAVIQTDLSPFKIALELQAIKDKVEVQWIEIHGTMVDVFGLGILLTGISGVGKSETALGLIERRHRLVGDDLIRLERYSEGLVGSAAQMTRHHMEIRGIGILNIAHMFGIVSVAESKLLDMVVELETWSADQDYDRLGLEWGYTEFLGTSVPHHRLPVKPGRDLVLLIETIVRNHRLRQMGFNSAKEIQQRLQDEIDKKTKDFRESLKGGV